MFNAKARHAMTGLVVIATLALPMQAAAAEPVPFSASESGTFQVLGVCATGGVVLDVNGTGQATQLGNYTAHYRECLDPATGAVTNGSFVLTAADGDTLFGAYSGQAQPTSNPSVVHYDDPGVITGGTGRFVGASGLVTASGTADLATGEYTGRLAGSVLA